MFKISISPLIDTLACSRLR